MHRAGRIMGSGQDSFGKWIKEEVRQLEVDKTPLENGLKKKLDNWKSMIWFG